MKAKLRRLAARVMLSLPPFESAVRFCCRRPALNRLLQTGGIVIAIPEVAKGPIDRVAQLDGYKLCVDIRNRASARQYFYGETEVPPIVDQCVKTGDTCLDIGANFGVFTCHLASRVGPTGRVVAYEPNPRMAEYLRRSIDLNGFEGFTEVSEVAVCEDAVSSRSFNLCNSHVNTGLSSLLSAADRRLEHPPNGQVEIIKVPTSTLAAEFEQRCFRSVRFAKIDVEGAGPLVLEGGKQLLADGRIEHVLIEVRDVHSSFDQLRSYGFECRWVDGEQTTIARRADERRFGDLFAIHAAEGASITSPSVGIVPRALEDSNS